ncbi:DNA-binding transcriptional LysR family regulator [Paenibacillus rhizosphaerae]|uniref:DNA-binding transcriptional LysR family regulator n=1 Tax=Paenibacillus rhizosphaerae TaxID=297318 RepID=A0A839TFJ1_9BACL|nr:DNA-binding transcriptional LysR family regulator [Paenibacillus rhizosphaerae]
MPELFLALPQQHRWSSKSKISLEELQDEPFVGLKTTCGLNYTIQQLFAKKQIRPNTVFEADELDTVAGLVSAGFGVALLPKTVGVQNHRLQWVKVDDPECKLPIGWCGKKTGRLRLYRTFSWISSAKSTPWLSGSNAASVHFILEMPPLIRLTLTVMMPMLL